MVVRDGSGDPPDGPRDSGRFGNPPGGLGRVEGPSGSSGTGGGTDGVARDGSGDPPDGLGWVGRPSRKSVMSRVPSGMFGTDIKTLMEVRDGSGDFPEGTGRVEGPYWTSVMGRGTLEEVQDGSGDPRGCLGRVGRLRKGTNRLLDSRRFVPFLSIFHPARVGFPLFLNETTI